MDLLQRVCTVSVETVRIVNQLNGLSSIEPENDEEAMERVLAHLDWWVANEGPYMVDERGKRVRYDNEGPYIVDEGGKRVRYRTRFRPIFVQ